MANGSNRTIVGRASAVDDEGIIILSSGGDCRNDSNNIGCAAYMNYPGVENPPILLDYMDPPSISANGKYYAYSQDNGVASNSEIELGGQRLVAYQSLIIVAIWLTGTKMVTYT